MQIKYLLIVVVFLKVNLILAQKDSIIHLDEIVLPITTLKNFSKGYYTKILTDTIVKQNGISLTDVLRYNSFIYFKENGYGMVSSPSFRGTNASQTAVVWNGININSQLNGQTDFNTIEINALDNVAIRSGGGSVLFGTGAIGGTVHLNNDILFTHKNEKELSFSYGSFSTLQTHFTGTHSTSKKYVNTTVSYTISENNYRFLGTDLSNENGAFTTYSISGNFGYKFSEKNQLKFYSTTFVGDRNLSRTLTAPATSKYKNTTTKNLLEWNHFISSKEILTLKSAVLGEKYTYFEDHTKPHFFSGGNSLRLIGLLDYKKKFSSKINFNSIFSYENVIGKGDNLHQKTRNIFAGVLLLNHKVNSIISYGIQFRKEHITNYNAPFVYSLGIDFKLNKIYTVSFNTSKNFRTPTFNDLYWKFGGNPNLKPETSHQYEIGNQLKMGDVHFQFNGFYIVSNDLIQWRPDATGNWTPVNVAKSANNGFETSISYLKNLGNHQLYFSSNYSFTIAKNKVTNQDLIYVPKHKANFLVRYNFKKITLFYQQLFNGKVIAIGEELPSFAIGNLGVDYKINSKTPLVIGVKMNNIFNINYQNVLNRPMPTRNIHATLNLKF